MTTGVDAVESYSQIQSAGTGDLVRTVTLTLLQGDGTRVTVKAEVIAITDEEGNILGGDEQPMMVDSFELGTKITDLTEAVNKLCDIMSLAYDIHLD